MRVSASGEKNIFVGLVGSNPVEPVGEAHLLKPPVIFVENTPVTVELRDVIKLH